MARALMSQPEMVLLDEPTAGVNPALKQSLLDKVREVLMEGTTVMFVEHDMDMVRDISDWVVVMGEGAVIAEGTHETIGRNPTVIDAYLGSHHDQPLSFEEEQAALDAADEAIEGESA
jgi:branched-chain amino acid transport system ATP-binding protein